MYIVKIKWEYWIIKVFPWWLLVMFLCRFSDYFLYLFLVFSRLFAWRYGKTAINNYDCSAVSVVWRLFYISSFDESFFRSIEFSSLIYPSTSRSLSSHSFFLPLPTSSPKNPINISGASSTKSVEHAFSGSLHLPHYFHAYHSTFAFHPFYDLLMQWFITVCLVAVEHASSSSLSPYTLNVLIIRIF